MSGDSQPNNIWAQGNFNAGITVVTDPTPGTSPEDGTLNSQDVAGDGGHSRGTLDTAQPGACVFEQTSFHGQASEDVGYEVDDENRPVEKLETGKQALLYGLTLSAQESHVPAYEVTPEETQTGLQVIRSCVKASPNALGMALVVSHQDVHSSQRLDSLAGIDCGAQQLEEAFTMCGLAVVRLVNPTKRELLAVIRAMILDRADPMAIEYPASYKYFFFYTTGHGANKVFFTKDGSISYQDVYDLYQGFLCQRYFFFDCCRSIRIDSMSLYPNGDRVLPPCLEFSIDPYNCVIYATVSGQQAFGPGDGVSFMTKKMVGLLKKQIPMNKVLYRLQEEVNDATGEMKQVVVVLNATPIYSKIHLWKEQEQAMNPKLQVVPHVSRDSAVVYLSAEFPAPTTTSKFHHRKSLQFQMKSQTGTWITLSDEYQESSDPVSIPQPARRRASTATTASQPSYVPLQEIASYERGRDLVSPIRPSHYNSNQQAPNVSQVTRALKIPVTEVGKRMTEFRVVSKLNGGLELESNTVFGIVDLVQPVICKHDSVIEFEGSQEPRVSICWTIRQVPFTISYQQFSIRVFKKGKQGNLQSVFSKKIDFDPQKEHHKESFDVPDLSDETDGDTYLVVVEAKRVDGQTVCSEKTSLKTSKSFCLNWQRLVEFVAFVLFLTAIIALLSSMIGINTSEMNEYRYNASAMLSYTTLGIPTAQRNASFFDCLLHFDYKNQQVIKHKDIDLYCGQFTKLQLANSRAPKFWGPNDIEINQRNKKLEVPVDFLPIGSSIASAINLLPRSIFSVYLCLSAPVDGTIVFELYRYEHFTTSEPLQRKAVTFNYSTSCSNTSLNVLEPNLVIGALSTNSTIHPEFTMIQGYVQQYYYDEKHLGLINDTYLVGDQPKTIPGSIETELVCYANGDRSRTVFLHLFSVLVPTAWTLWKVIVIAITALVLVVAFIFCVFRRTLVRFVCNQYRQCRQRCGHNSYIKLNN